MLCRKPSTHGVALITCPPQVFDNTSLKHGIKIALKRAIAALPAERKNGLVPTIIGSQHTIRHELASCGEEIGRLIHRTLPTCDQSPIPPRFQTGHDLSTRPVNQFFDPDDVPQIIGAIMNRSNPCFKVRNTFRTFSKTFSGCVQFPPPSISSGETSRTGSRKVLLTEHIVADSVIETFPQSANQLP